MKLNFFTKEAKSYFFLEQKSKQKVKWEMMLQPALPKVRILLIPASILGSLPSHPRHFPQANAQ